MSILSNELRIGNLVGHQDSDYASDDDDIHFTGHIVELGHRTAIIFDGITTGTTLAYQELIPIPLTPEWLERCGFAFNGSLSHNGIRLSLSYSMWDNLAHTLSVNSPFGKTDMRYVHELQNWFFAVIGRELAIKEKV